MQGTLCEKIGEGVTADIHAWAPGRVVKLFKAGVTPQFGGYEARITRAIFAAGGPAPEVFDEVAVDGRFGIVLSRFDGPALQQLLLSRAVTCEEAGAILASLYASVHKTPAPAELVSLRDWIAAAARASRAKLPKDIADGVLALIDREPPGDGLCHMDLHPGNVIMTADGPRAIDWVCALRAQPAFDIGRCHVTLTELVPEDADPEPSRVINATVKSEYARLTGTSADALMMTMAPHLTVLRAFVFLQRPISSAQRERLIQRIEAALVS